MKLYKIYMYILKSYVAKLLSAFVNAVLSSAHCLSSCSNACLIQWTLKYSLEHSAL